MWGIPVSLQFNFFTQPQIEAALTQAGFAIDEIVHREPTSASKSRPTGSRQWRSPQMTTMHEQPAENQEEAAVAAASSASLSPPGWTFLRECRTQRLDR
jgi:hypothetical protein